ncbi:MAG: ATP-binding cassette domain-containing protein [Syntrophobacterales bacterium]|nr:MAG: ATP-binding cassette domain-containing protein [Syntrophobacterales bacterium]
MNTVILENVTKTFGAFTAVDDLSLAVPKGSVYGFIGPNGSGKTTTLRMIMNIYYPDRGTIRVFGETPRGACADRIGYMPEERGLYKDMTIRDLLLFFGGLKNGKAVAEQSDLWIDKFGLREWACKKVRTLSKGMQQKVQFMATIVSQPEMVILDEPFTGLDPVNADVLRDAVLELQSRGTTVIFSTHDMAVAEKMCDFIFMIFKGKKVLDGTLENIQADYGSDTLRISTENGLAALDNIDGIENIRDFGQLQELRMAQTCDPQQVLAKIMSRTTVTRFEIAKPSLHDIFVRIAGPEAKETNHD